MEYESHRSAAMARRKLMNGRVQLWGHHIAVDWAEPELEVDEEIMAQVRGVIEIMQREGGKRGMGGMGGMGGREGGEGGEGGRTNDS